jgi:hypothetical protein
MAGCTAPKSTVAKWASKVEAGALISLKSQRLSFSSVRFTTKMSALAKGANREPSNQSFEVDRAATVCTAGRRFLPF